jgi:hypothetical protein
LANASVGARHARVTRSAETVRLGPQTAFRLLGQ